MDFGHDFGHLCSLLKWEIPVSIFYLLPSIFYPLSSDSSTMPDSDLYDG
jgi:hypothetical protein